MKNKRFGVPFFFLYTPELLCAFFHLPILQRLIWFGHKGADVHYSYELKCMSYTHSGFPVKPRKTSHTGFEKIREHYDLLDKKSYGVAFNDRYRTPLEKLNPFPELQHQIVPQDILSNPEQFQRLEEMYGKELLRSDSDPSLLLKRKWLKSTKMTKWVLFQCLRVGLK